MQCQTSIHLLFPPWPWTQGFNSWQQFALFWDLYFFKVSEMNLNFDLVWLLLRLLLKILLWWMRGWTWEGIWHPEGLGTDARQSCKYPGGPCINGAWLSFWQWNCSSVIILFLCITPLVYFSATSSTDNLGYKTQKGLATVCCSPHIYPRKCDFRTIWCCKLLVIVFMEGARDPVHW